MAFLFKTNNGLGHDAILHKHINHMRKILVADKLNGEERGVINLTLRDTQKHITNCNCWGQKQCIEEYNSMLNIGDIVDVVGAKVTSNNTQLIGAPGVQLQRYQPIATICCSLSVNEGHGYIVHHNPEDATTIQRLRNLIHVPHKPIRSALKLADVRGAGDQLRTYVDLLVVVASVRPVREFKRKVAHRNGSLKLQCLEMAVIDTSCPDGMIFTIWQPEWIRRSQYWQPRKTILYLIDVRTSYSEFYGSTVLTHSSCSLIYENPQSPGDDLKNLLNFAAVTPLKSFDFLAQTDSNSLPSAEEIRNQMTVKQIYARAEGDLRDAATEQFTTVLYAMVTKFDIDGLAMIINKKCKACHRLIPGNRSDCENESCQLEFSLCYSGVRYAHFFNINLHLSDHTGTLIEARLAGVVAEHVLGLNAETFQVLLDREKSKLKWQYLLKYFEVKLLIRKQAAMRRNLSAIIIDMKSVQLNQIIDKFNAF
ncbi:protein hold'em [Drosophila tropicalis]|uniref:protein hold'em n=1 Tax=Drosophila tropicalis TaxID=46794 RepID=UPI0035ABF6E8